jgi:hypothetical protein
MRSLCLLLLVASGSVGCWYAGESNGANNNLQFEHGGAELYAEQQGLESATAGVGLPFSLLVYRVPAQWQGLCSKPLTLHPMGGDPCGEAQPLHSTPIALVDAKCDNAGCDVTAPGANDPPPAGALGLQITPKRAGTVTLRVSVQATDHSGSWQDTYTFNAVPVARLAFVRAWWDTDAATSNYGVLVGTPVAWTPVALGAGNLSLVHTSDALTVAWQGAPITPVEAQRVGIATATVQGAGQTATATVRFFDPSEVSAIEVRTERQVSSNYIAVDGAITEGGALSEIVSPVYADVQDSYALLLRLQDGTYGLGDTRVLALGDPDAWLTPFATSSSASYGFTVNSARAETTQLLATIGSANLALPVVFVDGSDAGVGDAGLGDAGRSDASP